MDEGHGSGASVESRKRSRAYLVATLITAFLVTLGALGYFWASKGALATLVDKDGSPERDFRASMMEWIEAEQGDEFDGGDGARTAENETAYFRLLNGAKLELKPSSRIRFQGETDAKSLGVSVEMGEVDVQTSSGALTIQSEFGPITIFANSKMALKRTGDRLAVEVALGKIQLGDGTTTLESGDQVSLEEGGAIAQPEKSPAVATKELPKDEDEELNLDVGDGVNSSDLIVSPGDVFTVHDPSPPTRVGVRVFEVCDGKPARLTAGDQQTESRRIARLQFTTGRHRYEVRCLDDLDRIAETGSFAILKDAGTRNLPSFAPSANVSTDGRQYTVLYQHRLPKVHVTWPNAPQASSYTLQIGSRTLTTSSPAYTFGSLNRGTHQVTFSAASNPPRRSRTTTISVVYDSQAPAARVAMPPGGYDPGSSVEVAGQALPGWTVSVDGKELEVDGQRRFSASVKPEASLPITFSHPSYGTHYYLRRSKSSSP